MQKKNFSSNCDKCRSEEEYRRVSENIEEYQQISNYDWRKHKSRI